MPFFSFYQFVSFLNSQGSRGMNSITGVLDEPVFANSFSICWFDFFFIFRVAYSNSFSFINFIFFIFRVAEKMFSKPPTVVAYGDICSVPHYEEIRAALRAAGVGK